MSYFLRKSEQVCLAEIEAASDFVRKTFQSDINLDRLQDQIQELIGLKISDYYHQRFKDWTVADLIMLSQTLEKEIEKTKVSHKVDRKGQKAKGDEIGQEIKNHA